MSDRSDGSSFAGGCACGAIRYECSAEPVFSVNCHCLECQRVGGSAFTSLMIVPKADFRLVKGGPKYYESPADSGFFLQRGFCPECGSPVVATEDHRPLLVLVHAGSMDDPSRFEPAADIFASRAQPWDHMDPELPKIPEMPPLPDTELFRIRQG
jgi:hypothetical protein